MEITDYKYALLAIVVCLIWLWDSVSSFASLKIPVPKSTASDSSIIKKIMIICIGLVGWGLISFSMTLPKSPIGFSNNKIKVNDLFIVVDVSLSMNAEDFPPNRLEAAKDRIREFVKLRPTDRIGLIIFSEKAFTLLPLSTDLDLISKMIDEIKMGFLGNGTNIGDALGLAIGRAEQSLANNKVIILLTDGVSIVGNMTPIQAAEIAKEKNIKIYGIGIGKKEDARVLRDSNGRYQHIPGGSVDMKTLEEIAKITNGKSYYAGNQNALKNVLGEIQKLEKTEIESSGKVLYKQLYYNYLLIGIVLLVLCELFKRRLLGEVL